MGALSAPFAVNNQKFTFRQAVLSKILTYTTYTLLTPCNHLTSSPLRASVNSVSKK